jgi:AraC-like DNA-binding protein
MTTASAFDRGPRPSRRLAELNDPAAMRRSPAGVWTTYRTRMPEQAEEFVTATYGAQDVRLAADPATFDLSARHQHVDLFSVDVLRQVGHLEMVRGDTGRVYAIEVLEGRLGVKTTTGQLSLGAGGMLLAPTDVPRRITLDDVHLVSVGLDTLAFRRIAAELAGVDPLDVQFRLSCAGSPERARQWSAAARYVVQGVLANPTVVSSPVVLRETFRLLATLALEVFPQDDLSLSEREPAAAGPAPATIRRAVEFIEANALEDITVEDIARVCRLSVRGTQAAFKRHLGTTPAAYLRRVRLAGAHRDLMAADPTKGTGVADIALRWRFVHQGHFAASYRHYYGVPPSHTLIH